QSSVVPTIGSARFWILTGRDEGREDELRCRLDGARRVLSLLDARLARTPFLTGDRFDLADVAVYGYRHAAPDAGLALAPFPHVGRWLQEVEAQPGFTNDLVPYPDNARSGAGVSIYG